MERKSDITTFDLPKIPYEGKPVPPSIDGNNTFEGMQVLVTDRSGKPRTYGYPSTSLEFIKTLNKDVQSSLDDNERTLAEVTNALSSLVDEVARLSSELQSNYYNKTEIDAMSTRLMTFKGQVAKVTDLPENANIGDTYNVKSTGANYTWDGTEWDKLSETLDLTIFAEKDYVNDTFATKASLKEAEQVLQGNIDSISFDVASKAPQSELDIVSANSESNTVRMAALEDRVSHLSKTDIEVVPVELSTGEVALTEPKDYILSGNVAAKVSVNNANSLTFKGTEINAARVASSTVGETEFNSIVLTGDYPKSGGNTIVASTACEYFTVKNSTISATAYNCFEVGLGSSQNLPRSILFDGCNFTGSFSNNAISVFGTRDNAVLTLNNCHFESVSNILRISNRLNNHLTINVLNCSCDKWDSSPDFAGMIICQDYTSGSASAVEENNLFAPDKIQINISNFTLPNGQKLVMPEDLATICGSKNENQILYIYDQFNQTRAYNPDIYPSLRIF